MIQTTNFLQRKDAKKQRRSGIFSSMNSFNPNAFSFQNIFTTLQLCAFALSLVLLSGCNKTEQLQTAATDAAKPDAKAAESAKDPNLLTLSAESVKLAKLEFAEAVEREVVAPIEATGHVAINEDATARVGSLFSGRILEINAKVGDHVRKGQALAKMHTHEVHEAEAEWFKAQAELKQRQTEAAFAQTAMERAERLLRAKAISQHDVDKARLDYQSALQEIQRAEAEVERARGHHEHLGLAEDQHDYDAPIVIRAPSGGIVMKREITSGASVNPGDPLFFIGDLSSVWVIAEVAEKHLAAMRIGLPVEISVAAFPDTTFSGRITRIGEVMNAETRTVEVRCLADNRQGKLRPEMFATINVAAGAKRPAILVSQKALQEMDGQTVVFVAREKHRFERRVVKPGSKQGDLIEIISGLSVGDRVVTAGSFTLKSETQKSQLAEEE
ncbi:MAG: efflux RND transporter periplasmic adaptor subunit [Acidobacteria bacterium]|nr:efflux RND transporter periplasmic adaptor subunit [Acidobacteriota bacterium]